MSPTLKMLNERHRAALDEATGTLLKYLPNDGVKFTRQEMDAIIRSAFQAGLAAAYAANKFSLPNGVPAQGRN